MEQKEKVLDTVLQCGRNEGELSLHIRLLPAGTSLLLRPLVCCLVKMPRVNLRKANSVVGKSSLLRLKLLAVLAQVIS